MSVVLWDPISVRILWVWVVCCDGRRSFQLLYASRERESEFGICEKAAGCRSSVYHSRFKSRACQLSELISISVILAKEVKTFVVDNHKSEF